MLITNVSVMDVERGVTEVANVLLRDGVIQFVGSDVDGPDPFDGNGGLLLPGLVDCHAHVAFPGPDPLPRSARVIEAVSVLSGLLARGVTTVRDAWGADAGFRHALREAGSPGRTCS